MENITYIAEPTPAKFHSSNSFVRGIMGPIGSGKSVAMVAEIIARSLGQRVYNNTRHSRWCIIRNTYPELKSTTIKTWTEWVPESIAPIRWDIPITCNFKLPDIGDGTALDLEVIFLALDRDDQVKKLKSLELTGCFINEAVEVPKSAFDMACGRVGRFPPKRWGGSSWSGVIADTNPPDDNHWWYKLAEEQDVGELDVEMMEALGIDFSYEFFRQPPALLYENGKYIPNPYAENIRNHDLGYGYYLRQVPGKSKDWVNVYLLGNYGKIFDGKPVYSEYNDSIHTAHSELSPIENRDLVIGMDFGLNPTAIFTQMSPRGQFLVLDELCADGMGVRQFIKNVLKPHIHLHYSKFSLHFVGDPSGKRRSEANERTCFEEMKEAGFPCDGAKTNDPTARLEAVRSNLNRLVDGKPGMLVSPKCKMIRKGFNGGYQYKKVNTTGNDRYKVEPDKNEYSHPHDALQYACLWFEKDLKRQRYTVKKNDYKCGDPTAGY